MNPILKVINHKIGPIYMTYSSQFNTGYSGWALFRPNIKYGIHIITDPIWEVELYDKSIEGP